MWETLTQIKGRKILECNNVSIFKSIMSIFEFSPQPRSDDRYLTLWLSMSFVSIISVTRSVRFIHVVVTLVHILAYDNEDFYFYEQTLHLQDF